MSAATSPPPSAPTGTGPTANSSGRYVAGHYVIHLIMVAEEMFLMARMQYYKGLVVDMISIRWRLINYSVNKAD